MILGPSPPRPKARVDHDHPVLCTEGVAVMWRLSGMMIFLSPLESLAENLPSLETVEASPYCDGGLALSLIALETPYDPDPLFGQGFLLVLEALYEIYCYNFVKNSK
jgi:hypothetical protein